MKRIMILGLLASLALSENDFYDGTVRVVTLKGSIDLRAAATEADLRLVARGGPQDSSTISVRMAGDPRQRKVRMAPGSEGVTPLAPTLQRSRSRDGVKTVRVQTALYLNGRQTLHPFAADITVTLPPNVVGLISSTPELVPTTDANDGRKRYKLKSDKTFFGDLRMHYTTGPVTLRIEKVVQPSVVKRGATVRIKLTIHCLGPKNARNVILEDNFDPRLFSASGPEFSNVKGKPNGARILWTHKIDSIAVGQSVTVELEVKALADIKGKFLSTTKATMKNRLVGVSPSVRLQWPRGR